MLVDQGRPVAPLDRTFGRSRRRLPVRVPQVAVLALVVLDVLLRAVAGAPVGWLPVAGVLVLVAATAFVLRVDLRHAPRSWSAAVAVLDLLGIGLARLQEEIAGPVSLAALPAYFLGRHFGRAGVALAAGGTLVLVVGPSLALTGPDPGELARMTTTLLVVVAAAVAAAFTVRELRTEEGVARAIVETVPVGLLLVTDDGRYEAVNDRQEEHLGVAYPGGRDVEGPGLVFAADGVTPLAPDELPSARAARGECFDDVVVWVGDDASTRRALSVSARPVRDPGGRPGSAALSCQDVTTYLRAQAVKDAFVANVSHELRTPLASIRGYVELLADGPALSGPAREQLAAVERNADRLARLVDDLVLTAQLEQGVLALSPEPCDLAGLVGEGVARAGAVARQAGVTLDLEVRGDARVEVDAARIALVVDNLLANAVKFAAGSRVRVLVRGEPDWVYVSVEDDGPGIAAEDLSHVFERFYRAESVRTDEQQGVGLGLSIVRDVAEVHGGAARAWSAPGHGAVVEVKLPRLGAPVRPRRRVRTEPGPVSTW